MTIPAFEETWSNIKHFFGGRLIHRRNDQWGDILVVDNRHQRVLSFGSAYEQSCIDLRAPHIPVHEYTRGMLLGLAFAQPAHITFLGLGGGALIHSALHLVPDCEMQVIELREQVVEVAREYFNVPQKPNLDIVVADARFELRGTPDNSTDLVFSDLYFASEMNLYQRQKKFIQHCHRILTDEGWLVINFHRLPSLDDPFFNWIGALFPALFNCPTGSGNQIVIAGKTPLRDLGKVKPLVQELEQKMGTKIMPCFSRLARINPRGRAGE